MKIAPFSKTRGYSVLEILIVLIIIALVFSLGYANLRDFNRRKAVEIAARQLEGDIRLAQEYSLSGFKPSGFCQSDGDSLVGIEFQFIDANTYRARSLCSDGSYSGDLFQGTIPSDLHLALPADPTIVFEALGRGTDLVAPQTLSVGVCSDTGDLQVVVTSEGSISQSTTYSCP